MYSRSFYEAMLGDKPVAIYKKTIPGKVAVKVLDPFKIREGNIIELVLSGDGENATVKLFSEPEVAFFEKENRRLIRAGILQIVVDDDVKPVEKDEKMFSDEDIEEVLLDRYYKKFDSFIRTYVDDAPEHERRIRLARVVKIAKDLDIKKSRSNLLKAKMLEYGVTGVDL